VIGVGMDLCLLVAATLLIVFLTILGVFLYRIRVEARALQEPFGPE